MPSTTPKGAKEGSGVPGDLPEGYALYECPDGWLWIKWADLRKTEVRRDGPFDTKEEARREAWEHAAE
jgi:hypothetical protein